MKLRSKGLDLLHEPIDQLLRVAYRQCRNVVDRLIRIELRTLPARMRQRIHHVRTDAEEPEFENLKKAAGTRADDDDVGRDGRGCSGG